MEWNHFKSQIDRLKHHFTTKLYTDEFLKLLWNEIRECSNLWLQRFVDRSITDRDRAPLGPAFREAMSNEREYVWEDEKQIHKAESELAWSNLTGEEIHFRTEGIRKLALGAMPDPEKLCYQKVIKWKPDK